MYSAGHNTIDLPAIDNVNDITLRFLQCKKKGIEFPYKVYLYTSNDGKSYTLIATKDVPDFPNDQHDSWIDCISFKCNGNKYYRVAFEADNKVAIDEIFINMQIIK
ncbi:MAG: hypothetical protein J6B15_02385 [Muribaculaceae bacterium]|nr:hypothetical protein [Muribaculaceae bacterium]